MVFNRDERRVADLNWSAVQLPIEIHDTEGEMKFQLSYPLSEEDSIHLAQGNFIVIPDYELPNEFQAYEIISVAQDDEFISVDCDHIYIGDLNSGEKVSFNTNDDMADIAIISALQHERWQVGIVEVTARRKRSIVDMQPLEALRYIEKEWGGELRFRIVMQGTGFSAFYVDLLNRRGTFNGIRFEFGHNLINFKHTLDFSGIMTAMYGRGQGQAIANDPDGTAEGTQALTFANLAWSVANGDPVDKPLGQDWVGDESARELYGRPSGTTQYFDLVNPISFDSNISNYYEGQQYTLTVNIDSRAAFDAANVMVGDFISNDQLNNPKFAVIDSINGYDIHITSLMDYVDSTPLGWNFEKIYREIKVKKHIFGTWESQAQTELGLLQETWLKVRENSEPLLNIEANVQSLSELSPDFAYERTNLGDDVYVIVKKNNQNIAVLSRILKTERNRKNPEDTKYEIGNFVPVSNSERIAQVQHETDISKARRAIHDRSDIITSERKIPTSAMQGVIDAIQNEIISSMGFVYQDGNGLIILNDDRDTGNPTKAMRLSGGLFAISNEKDAQGEWIWRTYGDGDGFVADEIITGTLRADLVEIFGNAYFRWNGDNIYILDPNDAQRQIRLGNFEGTRWGIGFTTDGGNSWNAAMDFDGLKVSTSQISAAIDIGIRNFVINSTFNNELTNWNYGLGLPTYATIGAPESDKPTSSILTFDNAANATNLESFSDPILIDGDGVKEFGFSVDLKVDSIAAITGNVIELRAFNNNTDTSEAAAVWTRYFTITEAALTNGIWKRIGEVIKPTGKYLRVGAFQGGGTSKIYWREFMLNRGSKIMEWIAALEDDYSKINSLADKLQGVEFVVDSDQIFQKVSSSTDFTNLMKSKVNETTLKESYVDKGALGTAIDGVNTSVDTKINNIDYSAYVLNSEFITKSQSMEAKIKASGGVNLIRNSIGFAQFDFWTVISSGVLKTIQSPELSEMGFGSGWYSYSGVASSMIEQVLSVTAGQAHTLSFYLNKTKDDATNGWAVIQVFSESGTLLNTVGKTNGAGLTNGYEQFQYTFTPTTGKVSIKILFGSLATAVITGLMLNLGEVPLSWQMAAGEIYNTNVRFDLNGIRVTQYKDNRAVGYSVMTPQEFAGYYDKTGDGIPDRVFFLSEDETVSKKFRAVDEITMGTIKIVKVQTATHEGWAFVSIVADNTI